MKILVRKTVPAALDQHLAALIFAGKLPSYTLPNYHKVKLQMGLKR